MSFKPIFMTLLLILAAVLFMAGCSDNSSTAPNGGSSSVNFSDYSELVEEIAPPVYTQAQGAPAAIDDWTTGDYPLIGKVFSDDEPMSLYKNINDLDMQVEMLEQMLVTDGEEFSSDSSFITVVDVTAPLEIPTAARGVLGNTIEVEHFVNCAFDSTGQPLEDVTIHIGFTYNDTNEVLLIYHKMPKEGSSPVVFESNLFYAYRNLVTDSLDIRGIFYKDQDETSHASWMYDIKTSGESDFKYRMAWWGDDPGEDAFVGCIIGGGDKDVEYALKYKAFSYPDFINPQQTLVQMFGPNYSDLGSTLATGFEGFVVDDDMFLNEDLPTDLLTSPFLILLTQ